LGTTGIIDLQTVEWRKTLPRLALPYLTSPALLAFASHHHASPHITSPGLVWPAFCLQPVLGELGHLHMLLGTQEVWLVFVFFYGTCQGTLMVIITQLQHSSGCLVFVVLINNK